MSQWYEKWLRPCLFKLDAEKTHRLVLRLMPYLSYFFATNHASDNPKTISLWGREFPNRLGLAPGYDNNGYAIDALFRLGFGFLELGAVTPKAQAGNEKPRMFRLVKQQALINRMGFPNQGVDQLAQRLRAYSGNGLIGVNIGKNKETPLNHAADDYIYCMKALYPYVDYLTLNFSSPNTPGLRDLNQPEYLTALLAKVKQAKKLLKAEHQRDVPILAKISPDLTDEQLLSVVETAQQQGIAGFIATNTTVNRFDFGEKEAQEQGGLSGAPLFTTARDRVKKIHEITKGKLPIIAVGGISSAEQAKQMIDAGASLLQIYTGFIYQGPALIKKIIESF